MLPRVTKIGLAAAVAGAAMLVMSAAPASAFTLSSSAPAASVAGADIQHVWWDRWHHWRGPGWGWHRGWGPGWHHRHCWVGRWGHVHCGW